MMKRAILCIISVFMLFVIYSADAASVTAQDNDTAPINISDGTYSDGILTYTVGVPHDYRGVLLGALYDGEGRVICLKMKESGTEQEMSFETGGEDSGKITFMLWDSISGMKPILPAKTKQWNTQTSEIPFVTKPPTEESDLSLNFNTYPLYVGHDRNFGSFEISGASVELTAYVSENSAYDENDVAWSISDGSIIKVKSADKDKCEVQAVRTGFADVTAELPDGTKKSCRISVIEGYGRQTVERIEFNIEELNLAPGAEAAVKPIIYPKDIYENGMLDKTLVWESSDTAVVTTAENGTIKAVSEGTALITVTSADVGRTASFRINVSKDFADDEISADNSAVNMSVGEKTALNASCGGEIVWKSDNSYIADVDENGIVTAYSNSNRQVVGEYGASFSETAGMVKIYATAKNGGKTAEFDVCVSDAPVNVQYVSINKDKIALPLGTQKNITAIIAPARLVGVDVNWSSSDENIVKVDKTARTAADVNQAVLTPVNPGTAEITAEYGGKSDKCTVTVTQSIVKINDIEIDSSIEIDIDEVYTLVPTVTENASDTDIVWVGTDEDIATVGREGDVMGYKPGTVRAYAIAADSLSDEQKAQLKKWRRDGKRNVSEEEISPYLGGAYAVCDITVREGDWLRWLHIPEETVTSDSLNVLWSRASLCDVPDFKEYKIYLNGQLAASTQMLGYTFENLRADTVYEIKAAAYDTSGEKRAEQIVTAVTKPAPKVISVLDFGAVGDGRHTDTYAIQLAIDACPSGGEVWLPEGYIFCSGALYLKPDMTFTVDGTLLGSIDPKDYPLSVGRWEGWRKLPQDSSEWANTESRGGDDNKYLLDNEYIHSSLINIGVYDEGESSRMSPDNASDIVIAGKGQINANGYILAYNEGPNHITRSNGTSYFKAAAPVTDPTVRGNAIAAFNTHNLYIKNVQTAYSPSWTVHVIYGRNTTLDSMSIISSGNGTFGETGCGHLFNGDGVDPDSTSYMNLFNLYLNTGDDCVTLKSGRNREGNELDKPNAYIRITDCISDGGIGGFGTGSENAAGANNILFQNIKVNGSASYGIWLKTNKARGGVTENFLIRDAEFNGVECAVFIQDTYSSSQTNPANEYPSVRYLTMENISGAPTKSGITATGEYSSDIIIRKPNFTERVSCPTGAAKRVYVWDEVNTCDWGSGVTLYYTEVWEDTDIVLKETAYKVKSIDSETRVITAYEGATDSEIIDSIKAKLGGTQTYTIDGNVLYVTAEDGIHKSEYRIEYSDEIPIDAYLNFLSVVCRGKELITDFDRNVNEYRAKLDKSAESITVTAVPNDPNAVVVMTNNGIVFDGETELDGKNVIEITVTSSDDTDTKIYTLDIDSTYFIAEDFSSADDDTWGFLGSGGASVKAEFVSNSEGITPSTLKLLTSNGTGKYVTKELDEEITAEKKLHVCFDWQSNVVKGNSRYSYFALQDSSGKLVFGMFATGKDKVCCMTKAYDYYDEELENFSNSWYTVDLEIDFEAGVLNGTIVNKSTGNTVKTFTDEPITTGAENLSKMYAYDVYSAATMSIDNVFITYAQMSPASKAAGSISEFQWEF